MRVCGPRLHDAPEPRRSRPFKEHQLLRALLFGNKNCGLYPGLFARSEKRLTHRPFLPVSSFLGISFSKSRVCLGTWAALRRTGIGGRYRVSVSVYTPFFPSDLHMERKIIDHPNPVCHDRRQRRDSEIRISCAADCYITKRFLPPDLLADFFQISDKCSVTLLWFPY